MTLIEDTSEVRNRAYTPNEVEPSREPSPEHLYENPIFKKNKSNKCLIIGLFKNLRPFLLFSYLLNIGISISSVIAVGLLAWALVVTLKQPSTTTIPPTSEVSTFDEVCVKKLHQEKNELLVYLEANFNITRPIQSVNTVQSINDEEVSGLICRHIQTNQEFSGNSFEENQHSDVGDEC